LLTGIKSCSQKWAETTIHAAALVFAGQMSPDQRKQLKAGSIGGVVGLLVGCGVGKFRP